MIVVSDTSAITSLLKIGRADLLTKLFVAVIIPVAVYDELRRRHPEVPDFIQVRPAINVASVDGLRRFLGQGEAEAIVLAEEVGADVLLVDERRGRRIAESRGLTCLGLAGALLLAKELGVVPSLTPILTELERNANFYLRADVRDALLRQAGE